jgi:hypothetical protein
MDNDNRTVDQSKEQEGDRGGVLRRIEEKLDRLLGSREDDWHEREWAPLDSPVALYGAGDPSPRFFGGPRADAPGWDPSLAGPRFDRIDVGSVGTHGVDPVSSFDEAQRPLFTPHSSAREYYLLMRARERTRAGDGAPGYGDYRRRKKAELDREYADYCRDQQARFDHDFDAWRQKRGPPQSVDQPVRDEEPASQDKAKRR